MHRIREPRWTKPALVRPGDTLSVVVSDLTTRPVRARLADENRSFDLPPQDGTRYNFPLPDEVPAGLYDLELRSGNKLLCAEPNCVWRLAADPEEFTFAHISDLHLMAPGGEEPPDRSEVIRRMLDRLCLHAKPDFIVNTGDLVSRYGRGKQLYSEKNLSRQIQEIRRILLSCRIPQFISRGNHDTAFSYIRKEWGERMGGGDRSGSDNYAFEYGGVRFVQVERSAEYDEDHKPGDLYMSPEQMSWLSAELDGVRSGRPVALFFHYDYTAEMIPYLRHPAVALAMYGHSDVPWIPTELSGKDAGLGSADAYRVITVRKGRLRLNPAVAESEFR